MPSLPHGSSPTRRTVAGLILTLGLICGSAAYSAFWMRGLVEDPTVFADSVDDVLASRPVRAELSGRLVVAIKNDLLTPETEAVAASFDIDLDAELGRVADATVRSDVFADLYRQTLLDLHATIFAGDESAVLLDQLALTGAVVSATEQEAPNLVPFMTDGLVDVSAPVEDLPGLKGIDERLSLVIAQGALAFVLAAGAAFALHPVRPVVLRRIGVWMLGAAALQIIAAIAFPPLIGDLVDGDIPLAEAVLRSVTDRLVAPAILMVVLGAGLLLIAGRWYRAQSLVDEEAGATAFLDHSTPRRDSPGALAGDGHSTSVGGGSRNLREARV